MYRSVLTLCLVVTIGIALFRPVSADGKIPVFVSIVPQKYFVQQIGKELVNVQVMVKPGASPAAYEPRPRQMVAIAKARIFFSIGVPFEKFWLEKIASSNPNMVVVRTDREIKKIPIVAHLHSQKEEHHEHGTLDPHIWLSPPLVKTQARAILNGLLKVDPEHRSVYEANYTAFVTVIEKLDADLRAVFGGKKGTQFMVFHPAWGYFARTYDLKQVPIELEGKNPKPAMLKTLIEHAREHDIRVIFVQPQFSSKSAEQIAREIGGQVAFVDALALNWSENLREVAKKFKAALR